MKILRMCFRQHTHTENNMEIDRNHLGLTMNFTLSLGHQCTAVALFPKKHVECTMSNWKEEYGGLTFL